MDTLSPPQLEAAPTRRPATLARYGWLSGSALLVLAVVFERWFLARHVFPGDPWAARLGEMHKGRLVWDVTRAYQQVGRPLVAIGEVLAMGAWLRRSGDPRRVRGLVVALGASVSCGLIKILCGPTPFWLAQHHVGTNFPSGVVTFMTACGGYLVVVAWRAGARVGPAVGVVLILAAGPARVLGGQHLLSDVMGGYLLGGAWLLAAYVYLVGPAGPARAPAGWPLAGLQPLD